MKKLVALCVATVVVATTVAATSASAHHAAAPPTKKPGVLTVGLSLPSPGFQSGTVRGTNVLKPTGMEVEFAHDIATGLGLKTVKFYNFANFSNVYAPGPKPVDFTLAEVTITTARAKVVDFSAPYFNSNQGVLIRKGLSPAPKSIADLRKLQLCAQTGTTGQEYITSKIKPSKAGLFPSTTTLMYQAVEGGRCDAAIFDVPIIEAQKHLKPTAYGPIVGQIVTHEQYGAVFQKGSTLRPAVNTVIRKLIANGTVNKLTQKWFHYENSQLPIIK